MNNKTILCIEDHIQVQLFNKSLLEAKGFAVKLAMTLAQAREICAAEMPSLIILDIHLPDGNGLDFLRDLRQTSGVPVIALTKDSEEEHLVAGLAGGCDDYVTKPYAFPVLYARIGAVLRRISKLPDSIEKGALRLDVTAGRALVHGKDMLLTQKDFAMLLLFAQNEGRTVSAEALYEKLWKAPLAGNINALKNAVSRLRAKLGGSGYAIVTRRGEGYLFERE
jgi:DNA-binding response OmpR family regulator